MIFISCEAPDREAAAPQLVNSCRRRQRQAVNHCRSSLCVLSYVFLNQQSDLPNSWLIHIYIFFNLSPHEICRHWNRLKTMGDSVEPDCNSSSFVQIDAKITSTASSLLPAALKSLISLELGSSHWTSSENWRSMVRQSALSVADSRSAALCVCVGRLAGESNIRSLPQTR